MKRGELFISTHRNIKDVGEILIKLYRLNLKPKLSYYYFKPFLCEMCMSTFVLSIPPSLFLSMYWGLYISYRCAFE